jgi:hypothetical protein
MLSADGRGSKAVLEADAPASVPPRLRTRDRFVNGTRRGLASGLILRFSRRMQTTGAIGSGGTSYVLWAPRILADARRPQHAWQGFHPVHPTREGRAPSSGLSPMPCGAEVSHER